MRTWEKVNEALATEKKLRAKAETRAAQLAQENEHLRNQLRELGVPLRAN